MAYWLLKTEPDEFSIDDLKASPKKTTPWDGIRNYQARNLLRDEVKKGDLAFIYHSSCKLVGIAGIGEVVKEAYPDPDQFDEGAKYFDPKASEDKPRWYCVDVKFKKKFKEVIPLKTLKEVSALSEMVLLKQGRLSVQPVRVKEWNRILKMSEDM